MSIEPKFTRPVLTTQEWLSLTTATPSEFCKITQPEECKRADPELREACNQIFQSCKEFAEQLRRWHEIG